MSANRLKLIALFLIFIVSIGVVGYRLIENVSIIDALYMTVITVSTVGFREVTPLSVGGKVFTIFLITVGVGTVFYAVGTFINITIQDYLQNMFGRRRMEKRIKKISGHYIVAGYGRVGRNVVDEFSKAKKDFVVIENKPEKIAKLQELGILYLEGDATADEILLKAGIEKAAGLVAAIKSDADNVFIVLSARRANPNIFIIARSNEVESVDKIKAAGADRVVSPSVIGGRRMANWLLRPVVGDYLDLVSHGEALEYRLEEIELRPNSKLINKSIEESKIRDATGGAMILAIKRDEGLNTNPAIDTILAKNDLLIVIGTNEQLKELERMA